MTLKQLAAHCRMIAMAIDELLGMDQPTAHETPAVAEQIRKTFRARKPGVKAGYKYKPGTHWTQRPENQVRVIQIAKSRNRKRRRIA